MGGDSCLIVQSVEGGLRHAQRPDFYFGPLPPKFEVHSKQLGAVQALHMWSTYAQ